MRAARPLIAAHGAEEVKALGDALLIRSADAGQAVQLARELVCELGRRERALGVRVGVHTGTAVERDGDWFGSAVNVAARVADAAKADEVILTGATRAAAGAGLEVRPRGRRHFKNVTEAIDLYALVLDDLPSRRDIDPVCRMTIDPDTAEHHVSYRGTDYAFCSQRCRDAFVHNPRVYTRRGPSDHVRVSDEARALAAKTLGAAYRRGRLDAGELEERMNELWSARTRGDLRALTHDLPRRSGRRRSAWLSWVWPPVLYRRLVRRRLKRAAEGGGAPDGA